MTQAATAVTDAAESRRAGADLGGQIAAALGAQPADAVVIFAAPRYDHSVLLHALQEVCHPRQIVGCSSAGEFRGATVRVGGASALALRAPEMRFRASVGVGMASDRTRVAEQLASGFDGLRAHHYRHRTALILADALTGYSDDLIERLAIRTAGTYQFVGGGAGDNAEFQRTPVFCGTEVYRDAAVALEILSNKPLGIGVSHGWEPATSPLRVTAAEGLRLVSLNAAPAVDAFNEHAAALGMSLDPAAPLPFFLHHILGIETPGGYQLRVPLGVTDDGAVLCAAEVPVGALVRIMRSSAAGAAQAAQTAARSALQQLEPHQPAVALFFDCVATRLRLGEHFNRELASLQQVTGGVATVGCNTHGQIARAEGQFSGFHNCTAVVCAFPV